MSDFILSLRCPRCQHQWQKSAHLLEQYTEIYRQAKSTPPPAPPKIDTYRDQCPVCGTYVIISVQED